ncbi:MAG: hypothetical protein TREMPRED_002163 [Tremellales sp. Tagirdzhanova-0007]|nr:MAG: hypothetical protein TREMPRED_002163 [Tremellales sp. Tagirdzhanova-0007]
MGIVVGLFSAQAFGMFFTGSKGDIPGSWRYVVAISGIISAIQIAVAQLVYTPESEHPVTKPSNPSRDVEGGLSPVPEQDEAASSLLPDNPHPPEAQLPLRELISNTSLRGPTILCASILCLQQLSGVNAVLFYSTPVLRPLMPASAGSIGLQITLVNALMTVVAIFLVDRVGRKGLLLTSIIGMAITSALLAFALDIHHNILSASAIILFIVSFAVGLGPVPFLLVSEVVPSPVRLISQVSTSSLLMENSQAIPALASLSLSLNWVANFIIAILFLPLRDALSSPLDPSDPISERTGEGRFGGD